MRRRSAHASAPAIAWVSLTVPTEDFHADRVLERVQTEREEAGFQTFARNPD
jgi:hypothetical protein